MMVSPLVLDPVIQQLGLYPDLDRDRARALLTSRVRATMGKELLVRLEVEGATPEEARRTAEAILEAWLRSLLPSEREKADLQRRLEVATVGFDSTQKALSQLVVETPLAAGRREAGLSVAAIGELRDRYLDQVLAIQRELEGVQREVIKQAPTLPTRPVKPRKLVLAASAAVASFLPAARGAGPGAAAGARPGGSAGRGEAAPPARSAVAPPAQGTGRPGCLMRRCSRW
jgi:hypothetical protein